MAKRKSISKSIRFEVFKRDFFTCQYCGHKAPEVLLVIDHIEPVSKGGSNDILNLITSCKDCNSGKGNKKLSETTILDKQRQQLKELQERKEQLEMMFEWQKGLLDLDEQVIEQLADFWSEQVQGYHLTESGLKNLKKLKRRFNINEIMAAMKVAAEQYLIYKGNVPTKDSVELAWSKVGGICRNRKLVQDKPYMPRLFYIRGILKNRLGYFDPHRALQLLVEAVEDAGADTESLERFAKDVRNWTEWRSGMEEYIESNRINDDAIKASIEQD